MGSLRLSTRALLGLLLSILFVSGACLQPVTPMPPAPSTAAAVPNEAYWNELARYVWGQLTLAVGQ